MSLIPQCSKSLNVAFPVLLTTVQTIVRFYLETSTFPNLIDNVYVLSIELIQRTVISNNICIFF